ncbi:MAG TPA: Hpt domain-containing protein, partial [Candidatus Avimonas sp.]|nr:Hpt domain-containing protein [Candidatus Avimonas sp.]
MFSRIYTGDIEIIRLFINECKICLESLEKELLKLEVNFNDTEIIDLILKRIQSIKRGASFAGMPAIVRLCRGMELILDAIREGRLTVDAALIDSMLSFVDFLNTCFAELSKKLDDNAKNDSGYLEFEDVLDGERVLESLNHAYKNKVKTIESAVYNEQSPEDLDIIQPEELKMGQTEGIREQFLVECTEHIEKIENDLLLRLDSNSGDREAVNGMFRAVHSIKGGTGMYLATLIPKSQEYSNVKNFSEVAHTFESLMAIIRDKGCGFDGKLVDLSFNVMDFFKSFLKSVSDSRAESLQHQEILEAIKAEITRVQSLAAEIPQNAPDLPSQLIGSNDDNKSKNSMSQSIRVSQEKIDKMMNMISELIIAKNSFIHISEKLNLDYNLPEISKEVKQ